eukprot:2218180-Pyramimonas_sp.AAC.1
MTQHGVPATRAGRPGGVSATRDGRPLRGAKRSSWLADSGQGGRMRTAPRGPSVGLNMGPRNV